MNTKAKCADQLRAIRVAKNLAFQELKPNAEERKQLLLFNGWGTVKNLFSPKTEWERELLAQLKEELTPEEFAYAQESILNAFYTSPEVIQGIWSGLERLGFDGGKILEPSCGTLRFKECQPQRWQDYSQWFAIEQDHITGLVAKLLHPDAVVYPGYGFEEVAFPQELFDVCVGNVPFGDYKVFDPDYSHLDLRIHNYFLYKSLRLTKVGGFCVLITSTGTLDAPSNYHFRRTLAEIGDLIGAIRLPSSAFKLDAGTEVTSDILVFQRVSERDINFNDPKYDWLQSTKLNAIETARFYPELEFPEKQKKVTLLREFGFDFSVEYSLNYYYLHNPQLLLGTPCNDKLYGGDRFALAGDERDLTEAISLAFGSFVAQYNPAPDVRPFMPIPPQFMREPVQSFCRWNDKIYQRLEDEMAEIDSKDCDRIIQMLHLYNQLAIVIEMQKGENETRLMKSRSDLNVAYDAFIKEFGYLNSPTNQSILGTDISRYYLLMALEIPHKECLYSFKALLKSKQHFTKADIFFQRTARPNPDPLVADSAKDGLLISLNLRGYVDLELIAELTSKTTQDIIAELHEIDDPLIFFDPDQQRWVTKEQYLSGLDVRAKLRQAQSAELERNAIALAQIQPLYLLPPAPDEVRVEVAAKIGVEKCNTDVLTKFRMELGAAWVPDSIYESFAKVLIPRGKIGVTFFSTPVCGFSVEADSTAKDSAENLNSWGTGRCTGLSLLETGLNLRDPVVYDVITITNEYGEEVKRSVKNPEETENARNKLAQIKDAFNRWVWSDPERALQLTVLYNEKINCSVVRTYDGSHLTIPNCNPDIKFRPYQKDGIWRILQEQSTILGWVVGAGKTITFICAAMELKRLGLAHKPLLVVLDSTVPQIEAEFRKLYPTAKLLVLGPVTPSPQARRRFVTQIATCNWDAIICSHTQWFQGIQLSKETTIAYIQDELDQVENYLKDLEQVKDDDESRINLRLVKSARKRLENRLDTAITGVKYKKQKDGTVKEIKKRGLDRVINFEQMGVDCVVFDEFHYAKNTSRATKMGTIAGLPNPSSDRGMDTLVKIHWLLANGGRFVGATGTPISNTLAEGWTNLRYCMLPQLRNLGLDQFDAFASLFLEMTTESEISSLGKYIERRRCRNLVNRMEFLNLYRQVVDIITADKLDLEGVPTYKVIPVNCAPSPQQISYMDYLYDRAEVVESGQIDPAIDNKVWITTHGRQGMLDIRLVSPDGKNCIYSKVNACILNTYRIWKETGDLKAAQVIFINFSSPKKDSRFDLYRYIRAALVALGIPESEIAFIHDCDRSTKKATNKEREKLYNCVNTGEVRVVLGSIKKLGTGVNIQQRLVASHFLDCPYTPAEIDQGEGRIVRWGNKFGHVLLFRYVTEGRKGQAGIDAWLWQLQEIKSRQIWSSLDYENAARDIEDMNPVILSAATMKAIAMGDPRLRRKAEVDNLIRNYQIQRSGYQQNAFRTQVAIGTKKGIIAKAQDKIQLLERHLAQIDSYATEQPVIINSEEVYDRDAVIKACQEIDGEFRTYIDAVQKRQKKIEREMKERGMPAYDNSETIQAFDRTIGSYLGFTLEIDYIQNSIGLWLGDEELRHGLFSLIYYEEELKHELTREGFKELIVHKIDNQRIRLKTASDDLKALEAITNEQFPHEEELLALIKEQKQLNEELDPKKDDQVSRQENNNEDSEEDDDDTKWEKDAKPAKFIGVEPDIAMALKILLEENPLPQWWPELETAVASFQDDTLSEPDDIEPLSQYPSFLDDLVDFFDDNNEEESEPEDETSSPLLKMSFLDELETNQDDDLTKLSSLSFLDDLS